MRSKEVAASRNIKNGIRVSNSRSKKRHFNLTPRQIFTIVIMLVIFLGSSISYVWSNFEGTQIGYDLSRLQKQELKLKELNQKLRLELATLKSPQYLEEVAKSLGLKEARSDQIIVLQ
jgi:cell division protein FtsL